MKIDKDSITAIEVHAERLWTATVDVMAQAKADGALTVEIPAWADLTEQQRDDWIYSQGLERATMVLAAQAAAVVL